MLTINHLTLKVLNALLITLVLIPTTSLAQHTQPPIKLGMSTALTGPAKQIGEQLALGSKIYFDKVNKTQGINGQNIDLILADDGYEPKNTVVNTRQFLYTEKIHAIFGSMGTPTAHAIKPLLDRHRIPFLMPFTGADFLHNSSMPNVFNLRASYQDEAIEQINYLIKERNHQKIGLIIQADEFGYMVESNLITALEEFGIKPIEVARFRRNSSDISKALETLKQSEVTAVCMVGTYQPLAEFINTSYEQGFKPDFTSVSFVSSHDLFALVKHPANIMVTEVVPNPNKCENAWCNSFKEDIKPYKVTPNRIIFEGYLNAAALVEAAKECPTPLNNQCLLIQLNKTFDRDSELAALFSDPDKDKIKKIYRSYYKSN
ncbi:ABC transporter substrate-binding protein [Pseudoalteromonas sp. S4389]|uniref:ABC transporter substrate-binding protein n=1 Tax=Pseudoalteromonas sp. S4389 TaxID=579556 RepID=UPI0011086B00|nr:ABC transporter substrate-binding protein [Pseudoalteromonas sp. S4389]TMO42985.1 ABC transporter substrate-binding protein [Pseudoalteromonas sp. S4389]